jgi:hypothetical protein
MMYGSRNALRELFLRKEPSGIQSKASGIGRKNTAQGDHGHFSAAETLKARTVHERRLANSSWRINLRRLDDDNVLPHVHIMTAYTFCLVSIKHGVKYLDDDLPMEELATFLNHVQRARKYNSAEYTAANSTGGAEPEALPEDTSIKGQVWAQMLSPTSQFSSMSEDEEDDQERPSSGRIRKDRIILLGHRMASIS